MLEDALLPLWRLRRRPSSARRVRLIAVAVAAAAAAAPSPLERPQQLRVGAHQHLDGLQSAVLGGQIERRLAALIGQIRVGAVRQQRGQRTGMPVLGGTVGRRLTVVGLLIRIGRPMGVRDQLVDNVLVAGPGGQMERCGAARVRQIGGGIVCEQDVDYVAAVERRL